MNGLLTWAYANVLGNLVASAIWDIPLAAAFLAHHLHVKRRLDTLHQHITGSRLIIPMPAGAGSEPHADLRRAS